MLILKLAKTGCVCEEIVKPLDKEFYVCDFFNINTIDLEYVTNVLVKYPTICITDLRGLSIDKYRTINITTTLFDFENTIKDYLNEYVIIERITTGSKLKICLNNLNNSHLGKYVNNFIRTQTIDNILLNL